MQRKHLYGLSVSGNRGNKVERNDWWEVLFYLRKLDPSKLDKIFTMLPSYGVKVISKSCSLELMIAILRNHLQIIIFLFPLVLKQSGCYIKSVVY